MDRCLRKPRSDEDPRHDDEEEIGLTREQRDDDQDIEKDRYFELVLKRTGDLRDRLGLARAAHRQILRVHFAIAEHALAPHRQDAEEREGQEDLHKERQKDGFDAHRLSAGR
jgi:hypothetical protein